MEQKPLEGRGYLPLRRERETRQTTNQIQKSSITYHRNQCPPNFLKKLNENVKNIKLKPKTSISPQKYGTPVFMEVN